MLLLNGQPVETIIYPNLESLLKPDLDGTLGDDERAPLWSLPEVDEKIVITLFYEGDEDFFRLNILTSWIDDYYSLYKRCLFIPYMPYSRADRSENDSIFTLSYVCEFINQLRFDEITIVEPHSLVTVDKLFAHEVEVIESTVALIEPVCEAIGFDRKVDYLVFPDKGAADRYQHLAPPNVLIAEKHRDFDTGKIVSIEFPNPVEGRSAKALIVDDLCSRGGTFIGVGNRLKDMGFGEVHLLVTHFERVGYNQDLYNAMTSIHITDSMPQPDRAALSSEVCKKVIIHPLKDIIPNA